MAEDTEKTTTETQNKETTDGKKRSEPEDLLHKAYLFGLGLRKDLEETVNKLIERGEEKNEEREKAVDEAFKKARERVSPLEQKIEEMINSVLDSMNLVTKDKFEALEKRVAEMEAQLKKPPQA